MLYLACGGASAGHLVEEQRADVAPFAPVGDDCATRPCGQVDGEEESVEQEQPAKLKWKAMPRASRLGQGLVDRVEEEGEDLPAPTPSTNRSRRSAQ